MKLSKHPMVNALVFPAAFGVLAAVVYLAYASVKAAQIDAPSIMAYSPEHGIVFNLDRRLYRTDPNGNLIESIGFERLGLDEHLGDIEFADDALLVAEGSRHAIQKCTIPFRECRQLLKLDALSGVEALDMALSPNRTHLYVSISGKHRIEVYTAQGDFLYAMKADRSLHYPNDLIAPEENRIVVANTNRHRIDVIEHHGEHATQAAQIRVNETDGDYTWPTSVALAADGRLWSIVQDGMFDQSEVMIFGAVPSHNAATPSSHRLDLAPIGNPKALLALKDSMLVADADAVKLFEVSLEGLSFSPFGDTTIVKLLDETKREHDFWKAAIESAQYGIGFFILMLLAAVGIEVKNTKDKRALFSTMPSDRFEKPITPRKRLRPDREGIVWLEPKPFPRHVINLFILSMGGTVLLMGYALYKLNAEYGFDPVGVMLSAGLLMMMSSGIFLLAILAKNLGLDRAIGTDGKRIFLKVKQKRVDAPAKEVVYTGQRLIVGEESIAIQGRFGPMFDEEQLSAYIQPLLDVAVRKSEWGLEFEKLKSGNPVTWMSLVALILMLFVSWWIET